MNPEIRELMARAPRLRCEQVVTVLEQVRMRHADELERLILERAARMLAGEIAEKIRGKGQISRNRGFDGDVFRVEGIWCTHDELYRLMEDAYTLGMRRSARTNITPP
jgi:hypothetical protein